MAIHRPKRRDLARMWGADKHILRQTLDLAHMVLRHNHPPDAPSCHREILGEGIDHVTLVRNLKRRHRLGLILDAVVNLIADKGRALGMCRLNKRPHRRLVQHRPRRIRRRRHHKPLHIHFCKIIRHRLQTVGLGCLQINGL